MGSQMLTAFKQFLTHIGCRLSRRRLLQLQGVVNQLKIGRWMSDHHFHVGERARDSYGVWDVVVQQLRHRQVLYLEFGVAYGYSMR